MLWPPVRALCAKLVGDDADDVTQKALLKLFGEAARFDPERDALRWALSVAGWECRTERRRRSRRGASAEVELMDVRTPEQKVALRRTLEELEDALGQLSVQDREAIARGLNGEALGPTMRKRKERALRRLRRLFGRTHEA